MSKVFINDPLKPFREGKILVNIELSDSIPGISGYVYTARVVDTSKGMRDTIVGKVYKWDKQFSLRSHSLERATQLFSQRLSEVMSD